MRPIMLPPQRQWREWLPADLGISAANINTATDLDGSVIDLAGIKELYLSAVFTVVGTTANAGQLALWFIPLALDAGSTQIAAPIVVYTLDLRAVAGAAYASVAIGGGRVASLGVAPTGTLTIGPNLESLRALGKGRFRLENLTAHNYGTSAVMNLYARGLM